MDAFLRMLLECTLTTSALALLALALTPALTKRYSAKTVYLAWVIVLIAFVIPFRPSAAAPALTLDVPALAQPAERQARAAIEPPRKAATSMAAIAAELAATAETQAPIVKTSAPRVPKLSTAQILFAVWLTGALAVLAVSLARHARFVRAVRRWSRDARHPGYVSVLCAAKVELGIRADVRLKTCPMVDSPMLVGFFRPTILLPDMDLTLSEAHLVFRHELIHLKRGDLWCKALTLAALAVHWFNPLVPLVARAASFHCEASCDARVLQSADLDTRQYYSETILSVIRRQAGPKTLLSTSYRGGKTNMKKRILSIMDVGKKRLGVMVLCAALVSVLGVSLAFALTVPEEPEVYYGITFYLDIPGRFGVTEPERMISVRSDAFGRTQAHWMELPEEYGDAKQYWGKGFRFIVEEADRQLEKTSVVIPKMMEYAGETNYGKVLDFGEDFLVMTVIDNSAGIEQSPTATLTFTLTPETVIAHEEEPALKIGQSYVVLYDDQNVALWIQVARG